MWRKGQGIGLEIENLRVIRNTKVRSFEFPSIALNTHLMFSHKRLCSLCWHTFRDVELTTSLSLSFPLYLHLRIILLGPTEQG